VVDAGIGSLSVIRTSDNTVVGRITVGNTPRGVAALPDGDFVYTVNWGDDMVSVIGH